MSSREKITARSLRILLKSTRSETIINLLILIVRSLLPLAAIFLIRYYVDGIAAGGGDGTSSPAAVMVKLIAALALTLLSDDLLSSLGQYISKKQSYHLEDHISGMIHTQASALGLRFFDDPAYYDLLSRAARDISWRPAAMVTDFILLVRGLLSFAVMGYVLRTFGFLPLAIIVLVFIPVLWIKIRNSRRLYETRKRVTQHSRQASYFSWLLTGEKPAREVRLFSLAGYFGRLFREHFAASKEPELTAVRKNILLEGMASVIKVLAFAGVLLYATFSYIDSDITAGEMAMYLIAFRQAMVYLRDAVTGYSGLAENRLFLQDLFGFLDLESDMAGGERAPEPGSFSDITAEKITFTYPGAGRPALEDIDLNITRGEKVAVVGPNGSGKTTLVKLLCRLYDPDRGRIMLNGRNIDTIDPERYRRLFSVVFQNFMLYYLSAGDNIRLGAATEGKEGAGRVRSSDEGNKEAERVRNAAVMTGLHELLESLPEGYDTLLGHHTEGGRELSWGEWQKIAIARALYRDAPVLILDEPSSSLDADSEYEIFSDLGRITNGRTCIFISHRLSNVKEADRIILLEEGRITESGTHDDLMAAKGRYFSMYTRQKSMYR